jgi:quercetin dioxygenase-like cupin family protein
MTGPDPGNRTTAAAAGRADALILRPADIDPFARGAGVLTVPFVGAWNSAHASVTTGTTTFPVGAAIAPHTHNVEETVLVVGGLAVARIGEDRFELVAGEATWVPAGVPHCFENRGDTPLQIYWVYGGREVTRTSCATGETVVHLSDGDRGARRSP